MRYLIFSCILIFFGLRYLIYSRLKKRTDYLFVSLFVFYIPFNLVFFSPLEFFKYRTGAFNMTLHIEPFFILLFLLLIIQIAKNKPIKKIHLYPMAIVVVFFFLVSLLNPFNYAKSQTILLCLRLLFLFFSFYLITRSFNIATINKGIFDALFLLCILQFILAICFPVLNMTQVLTIFRASEALDWATGRGDRLSAIGIFIHPGNLGLFLCTAFFYFYASFLTKYKKKYSCWIMLIIFITLILSLSRSAWLAFLGGISVVSIAHFSKKQLLSMRNILIIFFSAAFVFFLLIKFTPMGSYFEGENFEEMGEARFLHWAAGFMVVQKAPLFGVGLNTHLEYLSQALPGLLTDFYAENPIHNIHIIILAETGIIGLFFWLCFFVYNINKSQKLYHITKVKECKILNLALIGMLVSIFIYGFFGWAPFQNEQIALSLFFVYMTSYCNATIKNKKKQTIRLKLLNAYYETKHENAVRATRL